MKVRQKPEASDYGWNSGSMGLSTYRRRSNITIAVILVLGAIAASGIVLLVLMLFSSQPAPRHTPPVSSPSPVAASAYDPYPVYFVRLSVELPGTAHLTREDAQARAYLGCGQTFAP